MICKTSPRQGGFSLYFKCLLKNFTRFKSVPREAIVWSLALIALACAEPLAESHVTICPLALLGVDICPGCGLGRSIIFLFHGHWQESFAAHPLGFFAVIFLLYRIISLTLTHLHYYGKNY
jgi:hypothetical protein